MKKQEIITKIKTSNLNLNEIIILSGASLVLQDVIENTEDIDISCSKKYYNTINWKIKKGAFGTNIKYQDVFEIGNNLYYPNDTITINGISCLNLQKCLEIKESLNREKDKKIIQELKEILHNKKQRRNFLYMSWMIRIIFAFLILANIRKESQKQMINMKIEVPTIKDLEEIDKAFNVSTYFRRIIIKWEIIRFQNILRKERRYVRE